MLSESAVGSVLFSFGLLRFFERLPIAMLLLCRLHPAASESGYTAGEDHVRGGGVSSGAPEVTL